KKMILMIILFSFSGLYSQIKNTNKETESNLIKTNKNFQSQNLVFTENKGQVTNMEGITRPDVLFTAHSGNTSLFLTKTGIYYQFHKNVFSKKDKKENLNDQHEIPEIEKTETYRFSIELQNANPNAKIKKEEKTPYTENFYTVACPEGITNVGTYNKVVYENVYPNIDWVIYSTGQYIKYDFVVHPGGDASLIKLKINDAK